MKAPRVTLEQWRTLQAVVDHGGFAQAAEALHRSQSSISYTVARMQEQLGVPLLRIDGRKAVLTEAGHLLLRRSRQLVKQASQLEELAHHMEQGWEAEVRLVMDAAYSDQPGDRAPSRAFMPQSRGCRRAAARGSAVRRRGGAARRRSRPGHQRPDPARPPGQRPVLGRVHRRRPPRPSAAPPAARADPSRIWKASCRLSSATPAAVRRGMSAGSAPSSAGPSAAWPPRRTFVSSGLGFAWLPQPPDRARAGRGPAQAAADGTGRHAGRASSSTATRTGYSAWPPRSSST